MQAPKLGSASATIRPPRPQNLPRIADESPLRYRRPSVSRPLYQQEKEENMASATPRQADLVSPTASNATLTKRKKKPKRNSIPQAPSGKAPPTPLNGPPDINLDLMPVHLLDALLFVPDDKTDFHVPDLKTRLELEEQGFFVGLVPDVTPQNMRRMMNRLKRTEPQHCWFVSHNQMDMLADPLRYIHQKPEQWMQTQSTKIIDPEQQDTNPHAIVFTKPIPSKKSAFQWDTDSRLIIDLVSLVFTEHPLMTAEQKLGLKIKEWVDAAHHRQRKNMAHFLEAKLESLKQSYELAKQELAKIRQDADRESPMYEGYKAAMFQAKVELLMLENETKRYQILKEMQATRILRDTESQTDRALEFKIVKAWEDLKTLRQRTGFVSIPGRLIINAKTVRKEKLVLQQELETEMQERQDLFEIEQARFQRQFQKIHAEWEARQEQYKQRFEQDKNQLEDPQDEESANLIEPSMQHLYPYDPEPLATQAPTFSVKKQKEEIKKRLKASIRPLHSSDEQHRRHQLQSARYAIAVNYNGKPVTRIAPKAIDPKTFEIKFEGIQDIQMSNIVTDSDVSRTAFAIQVNEAPEKITLQVFEQGIYGSILIGEIFVPIPTANEHASAYDRQVIQTEFSGKSFQRKPLTGLDGDSDGLAKGILNVSASWSDNVRVETLERDNSHIVALARASANPFGKKHTGMINEWIVDKSIDPNDPRNVDMLKLKQLVDNVYMRHGDMTMSYWKGKEFFRAQIPDWLRSATISVKFNNKDHKRLQTLVQRFNKQIIVTRPVPLLEEDMADKIYTTNAEIVKEDPNALVTYTGFLKRVRAYQLVRKSQLSRPKTIEQYVKEERYESIEDSTWLMNFLVQPSRPLAPTRTNRIFNAIGTPENCHILIQVARAAFLPTRKSNNPAKQDVVRPFVEVGFQKRTVRTETKTGLAPQWNEMLDIKVNAEDDDFTPESLMESDISMENLYINLFDELTIDMIEDDKDREQYTYERRERIDGLFPVSMPSNLFNYDRPIDQQTGQQSQPLLHLFITLDPPLFVSDEEPRLIRYCEQWTKLSPSKRQPMVLCQDLNGRTVLVTRYIAPLNPPARLVTVEEIVRFVAVIPHLPNRIAFGERCTLISTAEQILQVGSADGIERAILLCNYLLARKVEAKVVMGTDIFDGKMCYVMVPKTGPAPTTLQESKRPSWTSRFSFRTSQPRLLASDFQLYNPITGRIYDTVDPYCPLKEVLSIFNADNIWANAQADTPLAKMSFNLFDTAMWRPFFNAQFQPPIMTTIQPQTLYYSETTPEWLQNLETTIVQPLSQSRIIQI
ncbi:hypothetical protein EDD86DRAFT_245490 [Gorgonomyces haynaldii]|nr:hypothetical protein EDD86DRAFT_245490 [Gorgonomyces haynaldii]